MDRPSNPSLPVADMSAAGKEEDKGDINHALSKDQASPPNPAPPVMDNYEARHIEGGTTWAEYVLATKDVYQLDKFRVPPGASAGPRVYPPPFSPYRPPVGYPHSPYSSSLPSPSLESPSLQSPNLGSAPGKLPPLYSFPPPRRTSTSDRSSTSDDISPTHLTKTTGAIPPELPPSVEEAYRKKCIELKQRLIEVEEGNDATRQRIARLHRSVDKLRLERAFLMEQVSKRTSTNVEDSEGSPSPPPTVRLPLSTPLPNVDHYRRANANINSPRRSLFEPSAATASLIS